MNYADLLKLAIEAALRAGEKILEIYNTDFKVETKADDTPVTNADKAASASIINDLSSSGINVLSEEDEQFSYEIRKNWQHLWVVDPLDGTKEFVKRNGEFTVNIALIEANKPVIGVIYSPVFKHLYYAAIHSGSFKVNAHHVISALNSDVFDAGFLMSGASRLPINTPPLSYTIVASRSHLSKEVNERIAKAKLEFDNVNIINTGSSIKFCWVAEGLAHEYPRFGTTMEWDTAAGQCIIEEAGGRVIDLDTNLPMRYNRENLKNGNFIAFCKS
jgi:3'(2'), 5'-bisphosphate nucleotidase